MREKAENKRKENELTAVFERIKLFNQSFSRDSAGVKKTNKTESNDSIDRLNKDLNDYDYFQSYIQLTKMYLNAIHRQLNEKLDRNEIKIVDDRLKAKYEELNRLSESIQLKIDSIQSESDHLFIIFDLFLLLKLRNEILF